MDRKRERITEAASSRSPKFSRVDHTLDSVLALAGQHASARYAASDPLASPASPPVRLDPVFGDFPTLAFPYRPDTALAPLADPPLVQAGSFEAMLAGQGTGETHAAVATTGEGFPHPAFGGPGHGKGKAQAANTVCVIRFCISWSRRRGLGACEALRQPAACGGASPFSRKAR